MRLLQALLWGVIWAVTAAIAGYFLIMGLSPNQHDRGVEAAMTSCFLFAPLGALGGSIFGWLRSGRRRSHLPPPPE